MSGKFVEIEVEAYFHLQAAVGGRQVRVRIPAGSTVRDLMLAMARTYGPQFAAALFDPETGELTTFTRILVNGRELSFAGGAEAVLQEGDRIVLLPPAGGG